MLNIIQPIKSLGWVGLDFIEDKSKLKLNKEEYMKFEMKFIKIKYKSIIV